MKSPFIVVNVLPRRDAEQPEAVHNVLVNINKIVSISPAASVREGLLNEKTKAIMEISGDTYQITHTVEEMEQMILAHMDME